MTAMRRRFTYCLVALACIHTLAAAAADPDESQLAAARGLGGAMQIPLSCAANPVPRFSGDETAVVITALTPDTKMREYIFVLGEASPLLIVGKLGDPPDSGHPLISQTVLGISDVAGRGTNALMLESSGNLQRLALLRTSAGEVVLALANRFTDNPAVSSPVDISVYRLHIDPINDGELVYFAPAFSWQTANAYSSAAAGLNHTFGIVLSSDGQQSCAANPVPRP